MAAKLEVVDRWGKILTVIIAGAGLLIAAAYLYQAWEASLTRIS